MYFDFNFYSSLLLPFFVHGLLFTILLLFRSYKEEELSDRLLGILVLLSTLKVAYWMLGFAGWYDTHDAYSTFMFYFPFDYLVWIGPIMYLYFHSITTPNFKLGRTHSKHFLLPGLWVLLIIGKFIVDFVWYTPFPIEVENQYGTKGPFADWDKTNLVIDIGYLSFAYYTWLTLAAYRKYHAFIQENYSFSDDVDPRWLKKLLIWIAVGVGLFFLLNIYSIFIGNTTYKANWYAYFGLGLINYYLSIAGYFRKNSLQEKVIFQTEQIAEVNEDTPQEMTKTEAELAIQAALFELMRSQRPYLRSDLTLTELAKLLQTNAPAISKVINQTGSNFNDFINEYRVREVQHKIEKNEHKAQTLLAIAFDSGFNSKATFNRAFKKIVGQTPKAYIEALS